MPTVIRDSRRAQRHINVAELLVGGQRCPSRHVADELSRAFFPRFGAAFALLRKDVEGPQLLPGAHVVTADVFRPSPGLESIVAVTFTRFAAAVAADHDYIANYHRARESEVPRIVWRMTIERHSAVLPEVADERARLGVDGVEILAADSDDSRVGAVAPVRHSARALPGCFLQRRRRGL